jgi:septal ring factor EnvC (AmiA/AmiB activator)
MRILAPVLIGLPFLTAASAPLATAAPPIAPQLAQARAEQAAAEAEVGRLQRLASQARDEATRLRARQEAAAQEIEGAEARITASETELRLADAYVAAHRRHLERERRPIASLLAGLATMGARPPLVALFDRGGPDELVKVRILLDSTLPVIRKRTARLSAELVDGQRLQQTALVAKSELQRSRADLVTKRAQFAAWEKAAIERSLASGSRAVDIGDRGIAAGEMVVRMQGSAATVREAYRLAVELASFGVPQRPIPPEGRRNPLVPFAYALPATSRVSEGLGHVNDSGVQSRGLTLATTRGAALVAPAVGTVRFAGPYRDYDGILILDHGNGWMTLIVNVASPLRPGAKVHLGESIGQALGPIEVELSQNGRRISAAIIAGSSPTLSNAGKGG